MDQSWSTCTSNCINESYANQDQGLPPGFRFHPTDEELVTHYLANKIDNPTFTCRAVSDADLNKSEPWELPGKARMGEKEWYFFSARDRKYPTGMRTNRATEAGYWKATGKDREVVNGSGSAGRVVGMKKTLVFYRGRAPKGIKTNWVMHEYRNEGHKQLSSRASSSHSKDEWVVCRIFHKSPGGKKMGLSELRQASHMTIDSGATLYATSLPALLDSPAPTGSSGGGRSDQENLMFNALLHYNNSAIKSEATTYGTGSSLFNCTSMASLMARSNVTTSIMPPYTSTTSSPSLLSSTIGSGHMSHSVGANIVAPALPNQRASNPHSCQGVSSPNAINTFNNQNSPHNIGTLTPSNDHNNQHHLSSMRYANPTPYIDPLLSITPTSLAPPLSHLSCDLDTFWLYSDRL